MHDKANYWIGFKEQTIEIFSDSQYAVCGVNEWLANWSLNDWIISTGKPVTNRDLWEQVRALFTCELGSVGGEYRVWGDKLSV